MNYKHITLTVDSNIATLTFNRPEALNALNDALLTEFSLVLDDVEKDESIKVLVMTGAGDKAFIAGADISELAQLNPLETRLFAKKGNETLSKIQALPIPVIAAVNGFALGGGSEMALACDFIYASEKARFGLPEITLGLIPGFGGTQRLTKLIGKNMAKELIFTGKMLSAKEAKDLGIVNKVCTADTLMDQVMKTATQIASKGKISIRYAKQMINLAQDVDINSGCAHEIDAFSMCMASEDSKEGTQAFLEKRKAQFKGSLTR